MAKTSSMPFSTLLAGLSNPIAQKRKLAISRMMRRHTEREQAFASLLALLNDPEEQVCAAALKALGQLGNIQAIPALRPLLTHQKANLRLLTLQTLVRLDSQQAFPLPLFQSISPQAAHLIREFSPTKWLSRTLRDSELFGADRQCESLL